MPRPREEPTDLHRKKPRTNDGRIYALRRANRSTGDIETLLRQRHPDLLAFDADPEQSFLALSGVAEGEETIKAQDRQDRT